ncbi:MAG: N-6 DNA methylase [Planctomycetes bacterium]|nr:N-6 DNA methylase [Planctomycetota bacterium]
MSYHPGMPDPDHAQLRGCGDSVVELVKRFSEQQEAYKKQTYNETQVRREFIDPLFTALGWDVDNRAGHAEAYKDVVHEDAIKIGGTTKAPDYCFRIGGVRKFFVEAKKPAVGVKDDPGPAYQLRRYAWTNKLPLSIVTDFEEFAVYDCRIKPHPADQSSTARVMYLTFDQYPERWNDIAAIFAKEAILKGSFDKYAESNRRKRGTAEVDSEFLKEIESWREALARNIALRNPGLSVRDLNFAVSKTIDRLIFLRMCEDRGIETYAQLRILPNGPNIYPRLVELFHRADERYNSGLFHFRQEKNRVEAPDELTPTLTIDDQVLKDIIRRLYYPECPYEFSVMPAEILGQVYEQFLGKVIRLTKGHRAVVEEKPEVKKAGGVYYTPAYIVAYIVKHTVGKLVTEAGAPTKVANLRILDPACGSGSFLLVAYQYLLDWHLNWYLENDPERHARKKTPPIYQSPRRDPTSPGPSWRLTVAERKRILLNNIYGVDIDAQAVEVTKLSLLLKVLEGESQQSLDNQLRLFHERALPDLADNIKCGNSLIGPDFYDNQQMTLLDEEERYRINVFDWHTEFPEVFQSSASTAKQSPDRNPTRDRDPSRDGDPNCDGDPNPDGNPNWDVDPSPDGNPSPDRKGGVKHPTPRRPETAHTSSAKTQPLPDGRGSDYPGGFDAVIGNPPYVLLQSLGSREVFQYLSARFESARYKIDTYQVFTEQAWGLVKEQGLVGYITPNTFLRNKHARALRATLLGGSAIERLVLFDYNVFVAASVDTSIIVLRRLADLPRDHTVLIDRFSSPVEHESIGHVEQRVWMQREDLNFDLPTTDRAAKLLQKIDGQSVHLGEFATAYFGIQTHGRKSYVARESRGRSWKPALDGENISRYALVPPCEWVDTDPRSIKSGGKSSVYEDQRIGVRQIGQRPIATLLPGGWYSLNTIYNIYFTKPIALNLRFILGLLGSNLLGWYWELKFYDQKRTFPKVKKQPLLSLPITGTDLSQEENKARHDRMVELVERMLALHQQLAEAKTPTDKTAIQRQIDATDRQIDQLVYELYDLTDAEIRIVEEATAR